MMDGTSPAQPAQDAPPRWLWWGTLTGVALVIVVVAGAALWIASGATNPPVHGAVVWSDAALAWADGPRVRLGRGVARWWTAPDAVDAAGFTLSVRARHAPGVDSLAAWGVWIAQPDGARTVYAISAGGYWTVRICTARSLAAGAALEICRAPQPDWQWSPFPRIHAPGQANTITLHREPDGAIRLRVNEERLAAPVIGVQGAWGVWARGGADPGVLVWESAERR